MTLGSILVYQKIAPSPLFVDSTFDKQRKGFVCSNYFCMWYEVINTIRHKFTMTLYFNQMKIVLKVIYKKF